MEQAILNLLSLLNNEDVDLINMLYCKLDEIYKNKIPENKYSIDNISIRDKSTLMMGIEKLVNRFYYEDNKKYRVAISLYDEISIYKGKYQMVGNIWEFEKRFKLLEKIIYKHEKIKTQIINNLPIEFLAQKYLINKINLKLKNYETSKQ